MPYQRDLPGRKKVREFHLNVLKRWDRPAEELLRSGRRGTPPLLPLTRGLRRELIVEMQRRPGGSGCYAWLTIGFLSAALACPGLGRGS
jgi:hypothetical protein